MRHGLALVGLLLSLLLAAVTPAHARDTGAGAAVCGTEHVALARASEAAELQRTAESLRIANPAAFIGTVSHLWRTGRLPSCYANKRAAEALGWRPGSDLATIVPGRAIGGDPFGNRERRLPERWNGLYREADLPSRDGKRGAQRLVFANTPGGARVWVTVDHYRSFEALPGPLP